MLDLESWASGSILTGGNILLLEYLFACRKDSDANIGIIAILVHFEKTLLQNRISKTVHYIEKLRPLVNRTGCNTLGYDGCTK